MKRIKVDYNMNARGLGHGFALVVSSASVLIRPPTNQPTKQHTHHQTISQARNRAEYFTFFEWGNPVRKHPQVFLCRFRFGSVIWDSKWRLRTGNTRGDGNPLFANRLSLCLARCALLFLGMRKYFSKDWICKNGLT